eukprot:9818522-Ditylum_brightwellii.AAC.1
MIAFKNGCIRLTHSDFVYAVIASGNFIEDSHTCKYIHRTFCGIMNALLIICASPFERSILLSNSSEHNASGLVSTPNCCSKTAGSMHGRVDFAIDPPSDINTSAGCSSFLSG